ncbi:MAG: ABC transporter substrate-binding protein [Acetobacteraceae bacterium]|jgi:NitT/TauT family transport system substrate-binding protein
MVLARVMLLMAALALAASGPANAEDQLQKVTIASAGKGMSFIMQYVAIGAGYYKDEGLEPETIEVSSGTSQAAAVMGGSADFTQLGMPHTLRAVARGGDLVAIGSGFDKYPIALVISKTAAQRLGITDAMPPDEKIRRLHGVTIGITSPGSSTDEFMRTIMMVRGMDPDKDVKLQPIGIGAPMVAAMQLGRTDGFAFMSPFTDIAVSRGIGTVIADPMQDNLPEYQDVPYQVITTSRKTVEAKRPILLASLRAMTRAMLLCHQHPDQAKRIVREFFKEVDEADFNIAFDTYVKAVPTTPIVTPTQVANTLKMLNLSEKTPLSPTYDQVTDMTMAREAAKLLPGN